METGICSDLDCLVGIRMYASLSAVPYMERYGGRVPILVIIA